MQVTYETPARLVVEHRPVALSGAVFCCLIGSLMSTLHFFTDSKGEANSDLAIAFLGLLLTVALAFALVRVTERVKVSFRRGGTITIFHKRLFALDVATYALADLEDVEIMVGKVNPRIRCVGLRLRGEKELVPLHPRTAPLGHPEQVAEHIRNWVPIH